MKKYLFFSIILMVSFSVYSQENLTLSDAIQICLNRNYDIRIERQNVTVSENNNQWGNTGRLPTVALTVTSNNSIRNQSSDNQFFGGTLFPGFDLNNQRAFVLQPVASVNWVIFQGHKAVITKKRFEQLEAESFGNADVVVSNTLQALISAYYIAVLEKERLEEFSKQLDLTSDKYKQSLQRLEMGTIMQSEVLLEENNYLTDSANYILQELALKNAERNLNLLLAEPNIDKSYVLTDPLLPEKERYKWEDLTQAINQNVDLKKILLTQNILRLTTRQARADRYPVLTLNGGYNFNRNVSDLTDSKYSGPNDNFQTPPKPLVSRSGTYFVNFTLTFDLFNGGRINRQIKNAMVQEDIGNIRIDQLKTRINKDLLDAYNQYQTRLQLYEINKRKSKAAQINLNISSEKYNNGSINSFDFRDVQNNKLSASMQELQAIYNLMDSKITLMRLTGGLVEKWKENKSEVEE